MRVLMLISMLTLAAIAGSGCDKTTNPPNPPPASSKIDRPALDRAPAGGLPAELKPPR